MKNIFLLAFFLFSSYLISAQTEDTVKMVKSGELIEVTIKYNNGNIMQHGYLTTDNKLQGTWESFYEDGGKKCDATYDKGVKTGIWYYYYPDKSNKDTYENNEIVNVEELKPTN